MFVPATGIIDQTIISRKSRTIKNPKFIINKKTLFKNLKVAQSIYE